MRILKFGTWFLVIIVALFGCKKSESTTGDNAPAPPALSSFAFNALKVNGSFNGYTYNGINPNPVIKLTFTAPLDRNTVSSNLTFASATGTNISVNLAYEDNDNTVVITPAQPLQYLTKYNVVVSTALKSASGGNLQSNVSLQLLTAVDPADKFPTLTDDGLLDLVQKQTFKYFWDFGHPVSGLARERNTSGDVVTSGGSGFGIMAIIAGINRNYISKSDGLTRIQRIVGFLKNTAQKFHGAFPHWLNGSSGAVVPFSAKDDGADLVETSYLMEGLLTARQYFTGTGANETMLRADITTLYNNVEWDWFRQGNQNVLYWHWSPNYGFAINMKVQGWNEALMMYVLAASSPTHSIPKEVYDNGWAINGSMKNGSSYYGVNLPLGPAGGGPLFFEHYSFLGINPKGLTDTYANYETQTTAHTLINYNYCVSNPKSFAGYSSNCWGLTASDINGGYTASSPTNDVGVIAPTAAISSLPYTPVQSMQALRYFYYKLGDKLWGDYGFYDAFNLNDPWFSGSYLAIDQGPEVVMIENYRSGLLWQLFMSCPEVRSGMRNLGFNSPNL